MQEGIYQDFEEAVADNVRKLKLGGGMDPSTTLGPLIAPGALDRVRAGVTHRRINCCGSVRHQAVTSNMAQSAALRFCLLTLLCQHKLH